MKNAPGILLGLGLALALATGDAGAEERGTYMAQFENDLFSGTDRHYTNGLRLSWLSPEGGQSHDALARLRQLLEFAALDENTSTRYGWAFGQDIYTPEDRYRRDVITNDRPYAGWLYGALSLHTVTRHNNGRRDLESVELSLGIIGPEAMGEQAQDLVHEIRLIDTFEGWDNQLDTEPGLMLAYERKWRLAPPWDLGGGLQADLVPHMGYSVGNVLTHVGAGAAARIGVHLPEDFGPPSLIHGSTSLDRRREAGPTTVYLFGTADGRYVIRNIFLDGNTFDDGHSVDREPRVGLFGAGVAIEIGRFRIAYTNAMVTREFKGQDDISRFGAISASFQLSF
jgi:lipid A 3-O-deacylase